MSNLLRRDFLQAATLLPLATAAAMAKGTRVLKNVGVELYTVRTILPSDPASVLKKIDEIGYTEAEAIYATLDKIWPDLQKTNLKPVSAHVDTAFFLDADPTRLEAAIQNLKSKGLQYIVVPYIGENLRGDVNGYKKLAKSLDTAGAKARTAGLTLCYHNHAFEFGPVSGTTALDILLSETDKANVSLEMDMFWVSVAGHDPVAFLKKHAERIALLHLKDKKSGFPTQFNEHVPKDTFKEVGHGSIDVAAVLAAASTARVKHYFVEQDQTPGDPLESLKQSYDYLHSLKY